MRRLIIGCMAGLMIVSANLALAADLTITVTVSQSVALTVSPTSWAIGALTESGESSTSGGNFTVTNTGNTQEDVEIKGSNSSPSGWTISDSAVGNNQFMLGFKPLGGTSWNYLTTTPEPLVNDVPSGGTSKFDMNFKAPSSTNNGGVGQSITVTITAKAG